MTREQMRHKVDEYCTRRIHENPQHPCKECPQNGSRICCCENYWKTMSIQIVKADFEKFQRGEPVSKNVAFQYLTPGEKREYWKNHQTKRKLTVEQKKSRAEREKKWREENKEHLNEWKRNYYQKNKEKYQKLSRERYHEKKEKAQ